MASLTQHFAFSSPPRRLAALPITFNFNFAHLVKQVMGEQIWKGRFRSSQSSGDELTHPLNACACNKTQKQRHPGGEWLIHALFIMMWTLLFLLATRAFAASLPSLGSKYGSAEELMSEYFDWRLDTFPLAASQKGVHRNDLYLRDNSLQGFRDIQVGCDRYSLLARQLLEAEGLKMTELERHYLETMEENAEVCSRGMRVQAYLLAGPAFLSGVQSYIPDAFADKDTFDLKDLKDYDVVVQRLKHVPKYVSNVIEVLKEGVRKNMTLAAPSITRAEGKHLRLLSASPEETPFFKLFANLNETYPGDKYAIELMEEARNIIEKDIIPEYQNLKTYVFEEYINHTRPNIAITSLPDGNTFYYTCLRFHTTTDLSADEIHDIGLEEITSLRKGVMEVAKTLGKGNMTFSEFTKSVRDDPDQAFKTEEEVKEYITDLIYNKINPKMTQVLPEKYVSERKLRAEVKRNPSGGLFASYSASPFFGNNVNASGTFWLNLDKLDNFRKFELMALTLHETNPGHHLHLTAFMESSGFPNFLKARVGPTYGELPSSFPYYTAMLEGWALYSEFLGNELGLYEDPYDLLGYYSWNLLRAARLVVDTGIHSKGWSRQKAIDYLLDNTALSKGVAEGEVDRYITWPGQATAYKIGGRVIQQLREKQEMELGNDFDIRVFHERVMKCFGMLTKLEDCMTTMRMMDEGVKHPRKIM